MVLYAPSNASGIGGRGRSATMEDLRYMHDFTNNYFIGGTNVLAAIQPANRDNFNRNDDCNDYHDQQEQRWSSITQGSRWAKPEAFHCFKAQSHQFNCGSSEFMSRMCPSSQEIIAMTNKVSRRNMQRKQNHGLVITALELANAESTAACQVNALVDALWREEKYGHAPREKQHIPYASSWRISIVYK